MRMQQLRRGGPATVASTPPGSAAVVRLPAVLDAAAIEASRDDVVDAMDATDTAVVLDLADVTDIDDPALAWLVHCRRSAGDRGLELRLASTGPAVADRLRTSGLALLFGDPTAAQPVQRSWRVDDVVTARHPAAHGQRH